MNSRPAALSAVLFAILLTAAAPPAGVGPEEFSRIFYSELRRHRVTGLPEGEAWTELVPFFTTPLAAALERARKEQVEFQRQHPDEKPPWIEGDLFSSLFEGPKGFAIGAALMKGDTAEVPVFCEYTEGGRTTKWLDFLLLKKTAQGWRLDDIRYGGEWDFANTGTLQEALEPLPE